MNKYDFIGGAVAATILVAGGVMCVLGFIKLNEPIGEDEKPKSMTMSDYSQELVNLEKIDAPNNSADFQSNDSMEMPESVQDMDEIDRYLESIFPSSKGYSVTRNGEKNFSPMGLFSAPIGTTQNGLEAVLEAEMLNGNVKNFTEQMRMGKVRSYNVIGKLTAVSILVDSDGSMIAMGCINGVEFNDFCRIQ